MNEPLRLLLIDDHPLLRRGLSELLGASPAFCVVGSAADGEEGLALALALRPHLVVLDLHMRGMGGLATIAQLRCRLPECLVVVLTASDAREDLLAALRAGADGYLLKDGDPEHLLASLQNCCRGQLQLAPQLATLLAGEPVDAPRTPQAVELTARERQTLALIAEGLSNKLIARELGISDGTVKIHVKHLLSKLNLHSRLEVAAWAHRGGLRSGMAGER
ncbi:response regulator [Pseudomonas mangrovi]|uniref:DNA-binding response regulator n=1 Tax=Pseudomonas mangrovi TaxID=2161748 RepID=A0A2T5PAK0_9PSED|nr:response regulator [Pseudomonas mangrovi]PTU74769.1 DNA-binding response regulator [Pseudomonas mangrovi]